MEQVEQKASKLKKWGWWAVAGLAAVLVIAGLVITIFTSGPKPTNEVADADESTPEDLPAISESPSADLPKTGPEDSIVPILGVGIIGYLIALGINYGINSRVNTLRRRN